MTKADSSAHDNSNVTKTSKKPVHRTKTKIRVAGASARTRLEVRISPADKQLIEKAADAVRETTTSFVLHAARDAAEEILRREQVTVVAPDFYDAMIASLDSPARPNEALAAAARKNRATVKR
jgi:uncharacterized protein (DUF1778 family)